MSAASRLRKFRKYLVAGVVIIGGLVFFNYISISSGGVSFHSKYSFPSAVGVENFFLGNGLLIMGLLAALAILGMAAYALWDK